MDENVFKILKKVYYKKRYVRDENGYQIPVATNDSYNKDTGTWFYSTDILSSEELSCLQQSKYPLNTITYDTHDAAIIKLKELLEHPAISLHHMAAAYICGFCSYPRGRQPIISYLFAQSVPEHPFREAAPGDIHCNLCRMKKEFWLEKGNELFRNYWGYSWNEQPEAYYLDLEEFSQQQTPIPTQEDLHIFLSVIDLIRHAPKGETPGRLEQRIARAKLIPHCEKYRLRGQLMALAELGVMPNYLIKPMYDGFRDTQSYNKACQEAPGSHRSDIILPLGGWRGEYGICEERFHEIFGYFYGQMH